MDHLPPHHSPTPQLFLDLTWNVAWGAKWGNIIKWAFASNCLHFLCTSYLGFFLSYFCIISTLILNWETWVFYHLPSISFIVFSGDGYFVYGDQGGWFFGIKYITFEMRRREINLWFPLQINLHATQRSQIPVSCFQVIFKCDLLSCPLNKKRHFWCSKWKKEWQKWLRLYIKHIRIQLE